MIVSVIGLGLLGGSFAYKLKDLNIAKKIIGVDNNEEHCIEAVTLGIADEIKSFEEATKEADLIVVATPVNFIPKIVLSALDNIKQTAIVMDLGSTKEEICNAIKNHPNKARFVATHPMWGTEKSGPKAAQRDSFSGLTAIICNQEDCATDALNVVADIYKKIDMQIIYMQAKEHDIHVAYVSHISHITSFALALTTLNKQKEKDNYIKEIASAGFSSTVRLAKSSPQMWSSIFLQNKSNILDVLDEHITQIQTFKDLISKDDTQGLNFLMQKANEIKKIIG